MNRWRTATQGRGDLVVVAVISLLVLIGGLLNVQLAEGFAAVAGAVILALPGYAVAAALFPAATAGGLDRLIIVLGLGISILILTGFGLDRLGFGMSFASWTVGLALISLAGTAVAWTRRPSQTAAAATPQRTERRWLLRDVALLAIGGTLITVAVGIAVAVAQTQPSAGFTQLWIGPANAGQAEVGVRNGEGVPVVYRLVLSDAGQQVHEWTDIQLGPNEQWTTQIDVATGSDLELYRSDEPGTVYRRVHWGVSPTAVNGVPALNA